MSVQMKPDSAPVKLVETTITEQEGKVLEALRQLEYGELRVVVKGTEIVQIEEKKSIKL